MNTCKKNQKGSAIIMAMFFFSVASFVVFQLSQETLTESTLANQEIKKLKSYYAAQAGLEMALLRIKSYQEAKVNLSKLGEAAATQFGSKLDLVWQFPLPWPLPFTDDSLSTITKQDGEEVTKESLIKNLTFYHEIRDSGSRLDLNSLGSSVQSISEVTMESLMRSFKNLLATNETFRRAHSEQSIQEVLNNIADWVDPDTESRNGGSENQFYDAESQRGYPRNQSFLALSELLLVAKMDDLIYEKLRDLGTVYGTFGVNVNTADRDALFSINEQFTEYTVEEFIKLREEQKERSRQDLNKAQFDSILGQIGFRNIEEVHASGIPILFSPLSSFTVESSGITGEIETIIKADVLDAIALKEIFVTQLDKSAKPETDEDNIPADPSGAKKETTTHTRTQVAPQGRPFVVHMEITN
jgi:type II secretory pathway component PulK